MIPTRSGHPARSESVGNVCQRPAEGDLLLFIDSDGAETQSHSEGGGEPGSGAHGSWNPLPAFHALVILTGKLALSP